MILSPQRLQGGGRRGGDLCPSSRNLHKYPKHGLLEGKSSNIRIQQVSIIFLSLVAYHISIYDVKTKRNYQVFLFFSLTWHDIFCKSFGLNSKSKVSCADGGSQ